MKPLLPTAVQPLHPLPFPSLPHSGRGAESRQRNSPDTGNRGPSKGVNAHLRLSRPHARFLSMSVIVSASPSSLASSRSISSQFPLTQLSHLGSPRQVKAMAIVFYPYCRWHKPYSSAAIRRHHGRPLCPGPLRQPSGEPAHGGRRRAKLHLFVALRRYEELVRDAVCFRVVFPKHFEVTKDTVSCWHSHPAATKSDQCVQCDKCHHDEQNVLHPNSPSQISR